MTWLRLMSQMFLAILILLTLCQLLIVFLQLIYMVRILCRRLLLKPWEVFNRQMVECSSDSLKLCVLLTSHLSGCEDKLWQVRLENTRAFSSSRASAIRCKQFLIGLTGDRAGVKELALLRY